MNPLTAAERGDLAEALIPEAGALAVAVREEPRKQIADRLKGLSRHELEALAVILAAMVDPDRPMKDTFAWVDFDEYGDPLPWMKPAKRTVREAAKKPPRIRGGVDEVAVRRALTGEPVPLNSRERTRAVEIGILRGLDYDGVADVLRMNREAVKQSWDRTKKKRREAGLPVPELRVDEIRDAS